MLYCSVQRGVEWNFRALVTAEHRRGLLVEIDTRWRDRVASENIVNFGIGDGQSVRVRSPINVGGGRPGLHRPARDAMWSVLSSSVLLTTDNDSIKIRPGSAFSSYDPVDVTRKGCAVLRLLMDGFWRRCPSVRLQSSDASLIP